jgi:hypothetical protein
VIGLLLAEAPALPLHEAGKYVAGAYIVLFVIVLIYVAIMAIRLSRIERDLGELLSISTLDTPAGAHPDGRAQTGEQGPQPADEPHAGRESTPTYSVKGQT